MARNHGWCFIKPSQQNPECVRRVIYFECAAVIVCVGTAQCEPATLLHIGKIGIGTHKIETPSAF